MRSVLAVCLAGTLLGAPAVARGEAQSREQQRCVLRLLSGAVAIARAQSAIDAACVRDAGAGIVGDLRSCLAETSGATRLTNAVQRASRDALAYCATAPPEFGLPAAFDATLTDAAIVHQRSIVTELFGSEPDGAIIPASSDPAGAKCQARVTKRAEALLLAQAGIFAGCVKARLKAGASASADLDVCTRAARRNVARPSAKLVGAIERGSCESVEPATAFPGACGAAPDAGACLATRMYCRACRLAATSAALDVDCDEVDDGATNGSCRFPVSIAGDAIPFIGGPDGRIAGAIISLVEQPERQVLTSADGAFVFDGLEEGSEVTLALSHPDYHPIQTGTIRLGPSGAGRVTFQAVTHAVYDALAALLGVVPDKVSRCQMVTTVTRFGKSIYDPGAHGEAGATVTLVPPLPPEHGPIYFNASVLPDRSLVETSEDGGVLFIQVPPGEYTWTAHKPDTLLSRIRMKCRAGWLVNASPPWGLQTLPPPG